MVEANPLVEFIGEIGDHQKSAFLGGAEALLFPIDWPEPFGLVMIEAMAAARQWWPSAAAPHLKSSRGIRARFDLRFSATVMARRYLDVYGDLSAQRPFAEQLIDGHAARRHDPLSFAVLA
jgi:glycosyltransferase involved in cell wall biosynthesis